MNFLALLTSPSAKAATASSNSSTVLSSKIVSISFKIAEPFESSTDESDFNSAIQPFDS